MDDPGAANDQPTLRRRPHRGLIVLIWIFLFLLLSFIALFFGFNYFGERVLRQYLQEKIHASSNGLYQAGFKTLHVNILTGRVVIDSFELIPDTARYQRLKAQGKVARALYSISISSLSVDKVHFRQIFAHNRINFRQLTIRQPRIRIEGFPDTVVVKHSRWRVIYEDLYPAVSGFFNDFHIDSVKLNHGLFLTSFNKKTGSVSTGEYEFSAVLRDVSVNPFSYYNRDRVFYSRDVELVVHNFESQLADSLYSLRAEEVGFSLTKSTLYGKKASLVPNFNSEKVRQIKSGDLYRIDLPSFSINGIDLYKAMTGREVSVSTVSLADFFVQVYRNQPPPGTFIPKKSKKKITLDGLYSVVAKELRFIAVDTLYMKNGSFEFYGSLADARPELKIGTVNLELSQFRLDSLAHLDKSRIFYARGIELDLERISLLLRDGIHSINASRISFSTRKSTIDVREANIFPDRRKNLVQSAGSRNTMLVNLPRLTFTGIDLKKVFNRRIVDFDQLLISEPEVRYTRFREPINPDPRFKQPEDFFEAENDDVVYGLLKKYLRVIRGSDIRITQGLVKYSAEQNGVEIPMITSSFDLTMQQFLIDSLHGMNEQGYFYSRDFDLDLKSVSMMSPDSLKHLWADRVHFVTKDSLIESENIRIIKSVDPLQHSSKWNKRQSLAFEFRVGRMHVTGLNHKKLFLENILRANQVVLDNPSLHLKTSNNLQPVGPPKQPQLLKTKKFIHAFEIGRCLVRNGAVSYDGEEDRKASYFSLKDIEFALVNATIRIPEKGLHDGLIKFDSLQLKVVPLRAVIADSTYAFEARSLDVHSYPADITLRGIKVVPLKSWNEVPGRKSMVNITIPEIRFTGFYFDRAIFDNEWLLDGIYLDHPSVQYEMRHDESQGTGSGHVDPASLISTPQFMNTIAVHEFTVSGGDGQMIIHRPNKTQTWSLTNMMLEVTRFRVDSATRSNPAGTPLFNADDISLSAPGISLVSPDSLYTYSFGHIGFSTEKATAFLDSVTVVPNFSKSDFSRKLGHQTDRFVLRIPRIVLSELDFRKLVSDRQLTAASLRMDNLVFEDYLDKRVPFSDLQRPMMPGTAVAGIKFPLCIDTIAISNGFALYEEQTGDEPGKIFFDRLNATLTGLTTLKDTSAGSSVPGLDLHGTFRLMGTAPAEAWFHFQPGHPRDTFTMRATIGKLDLTDINPMLSKLMPASIVRGTATSTEILQVTGNGTKATGLMSFRYNDLAIRLHPAKPGAWNRLEQSLLTEIANLYLADSNPKENGKMKHGTIFFERDPSRGFFNFLWKSILSGLKSTMGINSEAQKEMIRQENQKARDMHRLEKKKKA